MKAMIEMTPAARERLDNYLARMRTELRGARSIAADEVEQGVCEHIEIALAQAPTPVGTADVIGVLDRLGPPERWIADEERPVWHRFADRLRNGPDDWRLAYLAFGLFLASFLLFPIGGPILIIAAMVVSRACVEVTRDRGETLGAQRWLVYPSIALVLAIAVVVFLIGLPVPMMKWAVEEHAFERMFDVPQNAEGRARFVLGIGAVVFGSWWILTAAFCAVFLRPIRYLFAPLLDGLLRKHFAVLAGIDRKSVV
jgi:hypothetical protein